MAIDLTTITAQELSSHLAANPEQTPGIIAQALLNANGNAGHNTYIEIQPIWVRAEAEGLEQRFYQQGAQTAPLYGVPVSLKDCFELAGFHTSCGTKFYEQHNGIALSDSWVAGRLREAGGVILGKTHLHPLAYGITGENPEFGDCLQPNNADLLTGGSSSGAAASILEGSAVAAIGTDTGGSIRVPAALCGIMGYRSSYGLGKWQGGFHLSQSFDTIGWLYRHASDGPLLAKALFDIDAVPSPVEPVIGVVPTSFFHDADQEILDELEEEKLRLSQSGAKLHTLNVDFWDDSVRIFTSIQAWEAARIHAGFYGEFEPSIQRRLEWGISISDQEIAHLRQDHSAFRQQMENRMGGSHFLLMPAAPVRRLRAKADHSETRIKLLRYTAPISLAGLPTVTLPSGSLLAAKRGKDAELLAYSAWLQR